MGSVAAMLPMGLPWPPNGVDVGMLPRDGGFDVTCFPGDIKVKHLQNDPRASLLVYDQAPPYRGVEIRANAVLSEIDAREFDQIAVRYLGEEAGMAYAAQVTGSVILVRLEPGNIRTWDFEGDF